MGRGSRPDRSQNVVPIPVPEPPAEEPDGAYVVDVAGPQRPAGDTSPADLDQEPAERGPEPGRVEDPVGPGDDPGRWWEEVDHAAIAEVPESWQERVYGSSPKWDWAEAFAEEREMDVDEYLLAVNAHSRQLLADGRPCMFVRPLALRKIIADNRFKNQHETGTSQGFMGRGPFEEMTLGTADPVGDPASAPVYGFVCADPEDERHEDLRGHYGKAIVVFRDRVRPRTTFTVGDSLDENLIGGPTTWASPINDPHQGSQLFNLDDPLDVEEIDDLSVTYVEVQYWGPVTLDDVEVVYVDDPSVASELRNAGVEAREFPY